MEFSKNHRTNILIIITYTVLLITVCIRISSIWGLLRTAAGVCFPFVLGAVIAFTLNVLMSALEERLLFRVRRELRRPLALIMTLLSVVLVLAVVLRLVVPELGKTVNLLFQQLPQLIRRAVDWMAELFDGRLEGSTWVSEIQLNLESLWSGVAEALKNGFTPVLMGAYGIMSGTITGLVNFVVGLVFAVYILLQKERLGEQAKKVLFAYVPVRHARRVLEIISLISRTFRSFIAGQCVEAVILGTLFFLCMTIFRIPYALMISVLIAVMALIPIFGAFVGCFVGSLLILMVSPVKALWFLILFLVLQQIEGNLIYPHVVGSSVGLPSIWVLAAVTAGGKLMGIFGMLLFIPLCSVLYTLFRESVYKRLHSRGIR